MTTFEIITLIIAGYAALLSTFLAVREIIKERKNLEIKIVISVFENTADLVLFNNSNKPLIVNSISIIISHGIPDHEETVHLVDMYSQDEKEWLNYPLTIEPFSEVRAGLNITLIKYIEDNLFKILVYDANGEIHKKHKLYYINTKYGGFGKKP